MALHRQIRNSAKAIIVRDEMLLVTRNKDHLGEYYLLPGGGQRHGETLHEALRRECKEEIGADIEVGELILVREYIGRNHEFAQHDSDTHQIEFMFQCRIPAFYSPQDGVQPDGPQTGVTWVPIRSLSGYRIYPSVLGRILGNRLPEGTTVYLGDVN